MCFALKEVMGSVAQMGCYRHLKLGEINFVPQVMWTKNTSELGHAGQG